VKPLLPLVPLMLAGTLLACPKEKATMGRPESSLPASPAGSPAPPSVAATARSGPPSAAREREEACVDGWLSERKLDRYGSPEGTMYAGGTPLFDERTGEQVNRLDHIYRKHPEARAACAPGTGGR
jgi:hypothetical protein